MAMLTVDVTFEEWDAFVELSKEQMTPRSWGRRWVAVFSTNSRGKEWSFTRWGNTPLNERFRLRGMRFLESVKREYLTLCGSGGRVFVNGKGAFYNKGTSKDKPVRFAVFRFPRVITGPAVEDAAPVHENADAESPANS
jgi:hypothetical protein